MHRAEAAARGRSLTIVIPALNEEEAIGETLRRTLAAVDSIRTAAGLDVVEIIVVNDGSTDRTAEIVRGFAEVRLIEFERNRGYGAAIKEGFRQGSGTLVGFMDADGTCDPQWFGAWRGRRLKTMPTWCSARGWEPTRRCRACGGWGTGSSPCSWGSAAGGR